SQNNPYNPAALHWSYLLLPYMEQMNLYKTLPQAPPPPAATWQSPPYLTALQTQLPYMLCPSTSDKPYYDDNSRGRAIPNRASASYVVVISGTIPINNNNDDGQAGAGPIGPFGFYALEHSRFDGPFNQNRPYRIRDILDGLSNTAAIGERYRYVEDPGNSGHGGWGIFAVGSPPAQNGHQLFSGPAFLPFHPILPDPRADTRHLIGFSSRHPGGLNFVFLDGSVRFLTDSLDEYIRTAIGTRAGGEVFKMDF